MANKKFSVFPRDEQWGRFTPAFLEAYMFHMAGPD